MSATTQHPDEAAELIKAIRDGQLDGFVVSEYGIEEVRLFAQADSAYRLLIDRIQQGAVTVTSDGTMLYANERFAAMVQSPLGSLTGRPLANYFPEADRRRLQELLAPKASSNKSAELTLLAAGGASLPVHIDAEIALGASGTCLVVTDLTETRRHQALIAAEAAGRAVFDQAVDAILMCDVNGTIVRVSQSAVALSETDPLRRTFASAFPLQGADGAPDLQSVLAGQVLRRLRYTLPQAGREAVELSLSAGPVMDAGGRTLGCVITMTDVTELAHAEAELRQADQRKDDFLAILAHELRNPLAPIRSALEYIRRESDVKPVVREAQALIARQIDNLVRLVDDLMDVTRIRLGKIEIECERVDLLQVVMAAVEASQPFIDSRDQQLNIALPEHALPVFADRVRLCQVVLNLLNNSSKFTPAGGEIQLTIGESVATRSAIITVQDTGHGIAPEILPRIFEPFVQAPRNHELNISGLGIGLYLARQIVEMHGGTIQAISDGPGRGAIFRVEFPLMDAAGEDQQRAGWPKAEPAAAGKRLLIVDDNRDAADSLRMLLQQAGHAVRVAYDGHSAVEIATEFLPDVVLLDLALPDVPGHEVFRRMRANSRLRHAQIVALTGFGSDADVLKTAASGFDDHIVKPASLEAIATIISRSVRPS